MEKVDLLIKSGTIVRSDSVFEAAIAIKDGKVAGILAGSLLPEAKQVIDAKGKVVMSGVIDPHNHMREPGITKREDWITGTMAAAAGGVTTVLEHPVSVPPTTTAKAFAGKREIAERKSLIDFGLYGGNGTTSIDRIGELVEAGAVAFKTFIWDYPDRQDEFAGITCTDDDALLEIFESMAKTGLVQVLHAESKAIVEHYTKKLIAAGRRDPTVHEASRPVLSEVEAVSRTVLFAMETGVRLNIPHLSSGSAAAVIKVAQDKGYRNITAETCPHYLLLTKERLAEIGPYGKVNPPLRSQEEQSLLWEYVLNGTVTTIGSDHGPHLSEHKERGWKDIFAAPAGSAAVETMLPAMLTAVSQGKLSLQMLTKVMSENVAKLYGLYPRKGVIQVGSDADLVIVDMAKEVTVDRHKAYTKDKESSRMFDGYHMVGLPVMTIVRGTVVMRDGQVVGEPGYGQFIARLKTAP
jgi:allantoinase